MSKPVLILITPKDRDPALELVIFPKESGKVGYGGYLNTDDDGQKMPPYRISMFVNTYDDGGIGFVVKGPIRQKEGGHWLLTPRTNGDGQYLNEKGDVVDEAEAADAYSYVRDKEGRLIFGVVANLWITNTKKDKTPTKRTMMTAKLFTDEEMQSIHEVVDPEEQKELRRSLGQWTTLFIENGYQFLREVGGTVRE